MFTLDDVDGEGFAHSSAIDGSLFAVNLADVVACYHDPETNTARLMFSCGKHAEVGLASVDYAALLGAWVRSRTGA